MEDRNQRVIDYMRVSVTDHCNLRCRYCMPEEGIPYYKNENILTIDEIETIVKAGSEIGIKKIKITGGEPLLREGILDLIKKVKEVEGMEEVTLTTNGVYLLKYANQLKELGINGINVNLAALNQELYEQITRRNHFKEVIEGIRKCISLGIKTKINCVLIKEINEKEVENFAELAKYYPLSVRFIEMMPMGYGKEYGMISNEEIKLRLDERYGNGRRMKERLGNGPAIYYQYSDFKGSIGYISAMSSNICDNCNRIRLTANGDLKLCLNYTEGVNLRDILRRNYHKNNDKKDSNEVVPVDSKEELIKLVKEALKEQIMNKPLKHCFCEPSQWKEDERRMAQIGG